MKTLIGWLCKVYVRLRSFHFEEVSRLFFVKPHSTSEPLAILIIEHSNISGYLSSGQKELIVGSCHPLIATNISTIISYCDLLPTPFI